MSHLPLSPTLSELEPRNRAALYLQGAQQHTDQLEAHRAQQQSSEFQQLLWLRYLDQHNSVELRRAEHLHALELETQKHQATIELRRLEWENQARLNGVSSLPKEQKQQEYFWNSKLFLALITVSLPIILPFLLRAMSQPTGTSVRKRRKIASADICSIALEITALFDEEGFFDDRPRFRSGCVRTGRSAKDTACGR